MRAKVCFNELTLLGRQDGCGTHNNISLTILHFCLINNIKQPYAWNSTQGAIVLV